MLGQEQILKKERKGVGWLCKVQSGILDGREERLSLLHKQTSDLHTEELAQPVGTLSARLYYKSV